MAQVTKAAALAAMLLLGAHAGLAAAPDFPPEVADAKAVDAFRHYWDAFEAYEASLLKSGEASFRKGWEEVKQSYKKEHARLSQAELASLQRSAERYRKHLEEHPNADNRPYVMLNLAQILSLIGDHLQNADANAGVFARNEALTLLADLEESYKTFPYREQALYLRAIVLESLGRDDDAYAAWQYLAAQARSTLYGVHARVAVGDYLFNREHPADAMRNYKKALELLPGVAADDPDYEQLRIDYRLIWAAYRATELNTVVDTGMALLIPKGHLRSTDQRLKIQQDAVDLMGDALYEANELGRTKDVLRYKELSAFAGAIGLKTLTRYNANSVHSQAVLLGEFLAEELPLAKEAPDILRVTADSWAKLGKPPKRIATLEKLALLLPAQSLWRARHRDDLEAVRHMSELAGQAARAVALAHYDTGLASGNPKAFEAAAGFYDILLDDAANAQEANDWRLRRAHCLYFSGRYDEAAKQYEALKTDFKVDAETLQVASYQLVLTNERRWHDAYAKAADKENDPLTDAGTLAALAGLEKSIDEFAARFANQSRAVDLLLVGASVNRDMNRLDAASKYWQRALVSQPSPTQRGIAVRGLVFAGLKTGSAGDVVELTRRFLKLEDWQAMGLTLGTELRGVLAAATLDEGKRLGGEGKALEGGQLMTQIAGEFPDVPGRDRMYRDGAYLLAIAGDWAGAQKGAEDYFKAGLTKNRDDMTYLLARAHEYQIRLHEAAAKYLELGEKYPKHVRAASSLERAEKLALAEGDYALAARAAATRAEHAKREKDRLAAYERAADYLEKDGSAPKALALAERRLRNSHTTSERLRSELLVAQMEYKSGAEQQGLDDLAVTAKRIDRAKNKMAAEDYAALAGEAYFLLGEEARRKFEDYRIKERDGAESAKVASKMRFFEDLVTEYDRAAAAGDPKWASQARYELAVSAEALADEIAQIPAREDEAVTFKAQKRYNATIERLQGVARRYHSTNVLAARRDPARYQDNEWVKKSSLRLSGETSDNPDARHKELMPASFESNLPSEWSL